MFICFSCNITIMAMLVQQTPVDTAPCGLMRAAEAEPVAADAKTARAITDTQSHQAQNG